MVLRIDLLNQIVCDNNFFTDIFDFFALIYSTIVSIGGAIVEVLGFIGDILAWSFGVVGASLNFVIEAMVFTQWIRTGFFLPEIIVSCLAVILVGITLKLVIDVFL